MEIELQNVSKRYGKNHALKEVDLVVKPGELVAVLGLNGAGKSTLLQALSGTMPLSKGKLLFDGQPFHPSQLEIRREMFFIPDTPNLFDSDTLLRNLSLFLTHYGRSEEPEINQRVIEMLDEFDLTEKIDCDIYSLSRGQAYRFAMVLINLIQPKIWILDEPFASGMDANGIQLFRKYANASVLNNSTVIYSTQLVDLAESFATRICVVDKGEIIALTTPGELRSLAVENDSLKKLLGKIENLDEGTPH